MLARCTFSTERCDEGSNRLSVSISSPSMSKRTGKFVFGENTSIMPPRMLKVPGISTDGSRLYPILIRWAMSSLKRNVWPGDNDNEAFLNDSIDNVLYRIPANDVTMMDGVLVWESVRDPKTCKRSVLVMWSVDGNS